MIKHIIFDCFGTLINTGNGSIKAVECILASVGSSVDAAIFYSDWKEVKKRMMSDSEFKNEKTLFEVSLAETFDKYGIRANATIEVKPMIASLFSDRVAFPDVQETLEKLTDKGLDFAVGSTSDTDSLMYYLKSNYLMFSRIYTSENIQVYKPASRFYETILQRSGWQVEECLFVGDNYLDDVCGPKSIGMKAVLLDRKEAYSGISMDPAPDYVINSLRELISII